MPELPEVEVVARQLREVLVGQVAGAVHVHHPDVFQPQAKLNRRSLRGTSCVGVRRRSKLLILDFSSDLVVTVHLRMTGHLWISPSAEVRPAHTHVCLELQRGRELRFRDPRRFGRVGLLPAENLADDSYIRRLGPEPFDLTVDDLANRLAARTGTIKGTLLDQSVVAGLGNIYVDEILHRVGVHPEQVANRLLSREIEALSSAMVDVLTEAIAVGGSSIRDYLGLSQEPGSFQDRHRVFGRSGLPCRQCGQAIAKRKVAGRGTHFCPFCQRLRRRKPRPRRSVTVRGTL